MDASASRAVDHPGAVNDINGVFGIHASSPILRPINMRLPSNERENSLSSCVGE